MNTRNDSILAGFDEAISNIVSLSGGPDALAEYRKHRAETDRQHALLMAVVRDNGLDALEAITQAMRYPRTGASYLRDAQKALAKALNAADQLDPPEAA